MKVLSLELNHLIIEKVSSTRRSKQPNKLREYVSPKGIKKILYINSSHAEVQLVSSSLLKIKSLDSLSEVLENKSPPIGSLDDVHYPIPLSNGPSACCSGSEEMEICLCDYESN